MTDDDLTDHDAAAIASFFEAQASGKSPAEWLKDEIAKMPPRPKPTLADRLGRLVELQAELERLRGVREKLLAWTDVAPQPKAKLLANLDQEVRSVYWLIFDLGIERAHCRVDVKRGKR